MLSDLEQSLIDLTTKLIGICQSNVVRIINQLKKAILSNSIRKCFKLKHVFNQLKTILSIRLYLFLILCVNLGCYDDGDLGCQKYEENAVKSTACVGAEVLK